LRCGGARPGHRLVPPARAALRPHQRAGRRVETRQGRLSSALAARVATAAALIAAFVAALFLLPKSWLAALVALILAGGGHEWARLCRLGGATAWSYAALVAIAFGVLFALGEAAVRPTLIVATLFWI